MKKPVLCTATVAVLLLFAAAVSPPIRASSLSIDLVTGNSALAGYPDPFGDLSIFVPDGGGDATITLTGDSQGGFDYLFGDSGTIGLNFIGPVSLVPNSIGWSGGDMSTAFSLGGAGQEDGFGSFNFTLNDFDGANSAVSQFTFEVALNSGSFADASSVLTPNTDGEQVASHIFVFSDCDGACTTGYAADGPAAAPEVSTWLLTLTGCFGLLVFKKFKRRKMAI